MNIKINLLLCLYFFFVKVKKCSFSNAVFSSAKLKTYLETEKSVLKDLETPMWSALSKKMIYRRYIEERRDQHEVAMRNVTKFLNNPINCYRLIKRLTVDLEFTGRIIRQYIEFNWNKSVSYPTRQDLLDAALVIAHLMHLYALGPGEMAEGIWRFHCNADGKEFYERFEPMSASDCIELGKAMYQLNYHVYGMRWVLRGEEILDRNSFLDRRYDNSEETPERLIAIANHEMAKGYHEYNKWYGAVKVKCPEVDKLNAYQLTGMSAVHNIDVEDAVEIFKNVSKRDTSVFLEDHLHFSGEQIEEHARLCNGHSQEHEDERKTSYISKLRCFYLSEASPSLGLVRIKVERLHYRPEVLLFYDVITNSEMETVRTIAEPKLHKAFTEDEEFDFQMTELLWNSSSLMKRLSKRVSRLSGLNVDHMTIINVLQYNIGGHFDLHIDAWWNEARIEEEGNNLATFMFYISEVEQAGATVFPTLGVSVFPVKGAALMWTNLLASGLPHLGTLHAGCPVLRGDKWVLTYRINLRGQEIIRPCLSRKRTKLKTD